MASDNGARSTSRRSFSWTMLGIGVAPGIAIARASKARRRIGVLEMGTPDPPELLWKEAAPLRALGWAEGNNLQVERRYGNGQLEALQPLAEELVRAQVEIIETWGAPATLAAKRATATIPIVFATAQDPVLHGLVESLARPGGNVTGYAANSVGVTAKCLSLLKELLPLLKRVGVLWQSEYAIRASRAEIEDACQSLRLQPVFVNFSAAVEIAPAIAASAREGAQALVVMQDGFAWSHRFEILDTATKLGLPTISQDPEMAEAGALIAYGRSQVELNRVLAENIDQILRGARPADLPVRQPTMFDLVINLGTARALGLAIPKVLLLRASEVVQ